MPLGAHSAHIVLCIVAVVKGAWQIMTLPPIPRVFWQKRLDLLDCKGVDFFGGDKESAS